MIMTFGGYVLSVELECIRQKVNQIRCFLQVMESHPAMKKTMLFVRQTQASLMVFLGLNSVYPFLGSFFLHNFSEP